MDLIARYNESNLFGKANNLVLRLIEPGKIEYKMTLTDDHLALPDVIHGGAIAGMMDALLSVSAFSSVASENMQVATVEFKISYLKAVRKKMTLTGLGSVIKKGSKLIFTEGKIYNDENQLIAQGTGTIMTFPVSS